jgi:hypothetical protein
MVDTFTVIPGRAEREPGISRHKLLDSGSAPSAHPGMTSKVI